MSASELQRADWLDSGFWDRLDRLESHHQRLQSEHYQARRDLDRVSATECEQLRNAWRRYCEVIAELDRNTAEFEALRSCSD